MTKKQEKEIKDLPVKRLKPHPLNAELYAPRTEQEIEELAQDMNANGQLEPIEVTPDGTIISGHCRLRAAQKLDWKTVRCWVRHDLAAAGPEAVEARLVEANLSRRHQNNIGLARSYRELKRLALSGKVVLSTDVKGDLRDILAKRFGMSGRHLDRLLKILDLPLTLQQAVDDGRLSQKLAGQWPSLSATVKKQIEERVSKGEEVKSIDNRDLAQGRARVTVDAGLKRLLRALHQAREDDLGDRIQELGERVDTNTIEAVRAGEKLISAVLTQLIYAHNKSQKAFRDASRRLRGGEEE